MKKEEEKTIFWINPFSGSEGRVEMIDPALQPSNRKGVGNRFAAY